MNGSPHLPHPSWHSSVARACPIALPSVVFLPPWISQRSRRCARCFSQTWSCEPARPFHQGDSGIVWAIIGSSWMSMAPNKPHDNEPFPLLLNFLLPIAVLTGSVLPPTWGASEARWLAPEQRYCRLTPNTGSAPSAERAMGSIVLN